MVAGALYVRHPSRREYVSNVSSRTVSSAPATVTGEARYARWNSVIWPVSASVSDIIAERPHRLVTAIGRAGPFRLNANFLCRCPLVLLRVTLSKVVAFPSPRLRLGSASRSVG